MPTADKRQVDGTHYRMEYQHWNFVEDIQCGYLIGCATKYLSRWRNKNGIPDLEKAVHYLEKYAEDNNVGPLKNPNKAQHYMECINRFGAQLPEWERRVLHMIMRNYLDDAIKSIRQLIDDEIHGPDASYVNQDPDLKGE